MSKQGLTGKRAVWLGMLGTPLLVIALVTLIGVTAGSAGPTVANAPSGPAAGAQTVGDWVTHTTALGAGTQTLAQLRNYWTPERMANAKPYPMPTSDYQRLSQGAVETLPQSSGELRYAAITADGGVTHGTLQASSSTQAFTEPFHGQIPFDRWEWFGRYLRNVPAGSPNQGISTVHKMFFTAAGGGDFVCSSSTSGPDSVWTAGHCVADPGVGFSTNVAFCPSYDSAQGGVNPTAGCWGSEELVTHSEWLNNGNLEFDFGASDSSDNPILGPQSGPIGNFTGVNNLVYTATNGFGPNNLHWMVLGYPAASPFNGGKIHVCSSQFGYVDDSDGGAAGTSFAVGCDMGGGSSGGPFLFTFGKPGQIGGGALFTCCNWLNGHTSWGHLPPAPEETVSPFFNCRALQLFYIINDLGAPPACP
jgi:V8-like Glu-specific endopeptidase